MVSDSTPKPRLSLKGDRALVRRLLHDYVARQRINLALAVTCMAGGAAIHVSRRMSFDGAKILAEKKLMEPARWATPWPDSITAETRASAAYRIALVASGEWDITMSLTQKSDWDLAAGDLVVREAGGLVTDRDAGLLIYNQKIPVHGSVICAGPQMHAQLLARLHDYRPP